MPGRYLSALVVECLATGSRLSARVREPLVYRSRSGERWEVPPGFLTDLASIPQPLQAVTGKWERHAPAAVLHDWLYVRHETTRAEADGLFREAMTAAGVPVWTRLAMWAAVRVFGRRAWSLAPARYRLELDRLAAAGRRETFTGETMTRRFDLCLAETLRWESGEPQIPGGVIRKGKWSYADDPHDPGGPTMVGVIQRVYDAWRRNQGLPTRPVRQIEDPEVRAIYRDQYWAAVRGDELPAGVDLAVFDFGVNSGVGRAIRYLQRAVGVTPDGHFGQATMAAVKAADPQALIERLMADRTKFVRGIKTYWRFGKGWEARLAGVRRASLAMAAPGGRPVPVADTVPAERASAGEIGQGRATQDPPNGMAQSTEGNAAVAMGGSGTVALGVETSTALAKSIDPEAGFSFLTFALTLAQSPLFWTSAITIGTSVYLWLRRKRRLDMEAV